MIEKTSLFRATAPWRLLLLLFVLASAVGVGCAEGGDPSDEVHSDVVILSVDVPDPILQGTTIAVTARGLDPEGSVRVLTLEAADTGARTVLQESGVAPVGAIAFQVTYDTIEALGVGMHNVNLVLAQEEQESPVFPTTLTFAKELGVALDAGVVGTYFRNDEAVLGGQGFVGGDEGTVEAEFVGTFLSEDGDTVVVSTRLPVLVVEAADRSRGLVRLSTALGGIEPGTFTGTMTLESRLNGGATSRSAEHSVDILFTEPALFDYAPADPYLGQIVTIRGGGFLGAVSSQESDEATVLRFEGEMTLPDGSTQVFGPKEAVSVFVSGQEVQLGIDAEVAEDELISSFFEVRRGTFEGTVTPVVLKGMDSYEGAATPIVVEISGVEQVVVVRFLPGFYDSLRHFGLALAANQVTETALHRMGGIWGPYNVRFVEELPEDYLPGSVATVEIGGPDPNGLGLFGYDNTPGKDIGNLRLHDSIGGANAETQADNYPGYGGVFIDSFMQWSSHPATGEAGSGPDAEPLFDDIFDPVRDNEATLEEAQSTVGDARIDQVQRAIRAMGSIVGETTAHELGHSFGLAQPRGPRDAFHSAFPGDGCLMDGGAFRDFGERAVEPGFPETHFCSDEPDYLQEILGRP